jgi:phosphatidylglycerol:prolipoprotein diacylglycerol transferase
VCWRNGLSFIRVCDYIAPCAPIGLFFGRCANFMNGELWGRVTTPTCPGRWSFPARPQSAPPQPALRSPARRGDPGHGADHAVLEDARALAAGPVDGHFATGYALSRFIVEFYREPDAQLEDFALRTGCRWASG